MLDRRQVLKARIRGATQLAGSMAGALPISEVLYMDAFRASANSLGVPLPPLYPLGAAANYSLLCCILRCVSETPVTRLLELGVGQSTRLIDALAKAGRMEALSLEADLRWAEIVASSVSHPVLHAPLIEKFVHGVSAQCFDTDLEGTFDAVVVDGPVGSRRRSRWGALDILDRYLADQFVVIFDDASRRGELDTIREFVRTAKAKVQTRFAHGAKSQCIVFTDKFAAAATFF